MSSNFVHSSWNKPEERFETSLRPSLLNEFIGQSALQERLLVFIDAAMERKEPFGHILFCGPPGLGKTTLANIIAKKAGTKLVTTSGPVLEKAGDLAGILTSLAEGDVLFIDEIHRLHRTIEEYLYPAMEDFKLDLMIDQGPNARSIQVKLKPFTLIGATTRAGLISGPMRTRFAFVGRMQYYTHEELLKIIERTARLLGLTIENNAALLIAQRSRGTPRITNHLVRWVRDYAQVNKETVVDVDLAQRALAMLSIDHHGLDEVDQKILRCLIEQHAGAPVGLTSLAIAIGEEPHTIEEIHEPYLILCGFLKRTPRGRVATSSAYTHLGFPPPLSLDRQI